MKNFLYILSLLFLIGLFSCSNNQTNFKSNWNFQHNRVWIGPEYWANRLQDWKLENGKVKCVQRDLDLRTLHVLPVYINDDSSSFECRLDFKYNYFEYKEDEPTYSGLLIGAGSLESDYRLRSIIQRGYGKDGGFIVALNSHQEIVILDNENERLVVASAELKHQVNEISDLSLNLKVMPMAGFYRFEVNVKKEKMELGTLSFNKIPAKALSGNIAIACSGMKRDTTAFVFNNLELFGNKLTRNDQMNFGPVMSALYTVDNQNVRMNIQLPPISDKDNQFVEIELKETNKSIWQYAGKSELIKPGWTALYNFNDLNPSKDYDYRIRYQLNWGKDKKRDFYYIGKINHNPVEKEQITVAAFSCNSHVQDNLSEKTNFSRDNIWFPHEELFANAIKNNPDLLVFLGDQIYEGKPTPQDDSGEFSSFLDYLYKWYLFTWCVNEYTKNLPTIVIPDDHDVYHGNLWGCGGKKAPRAPEEGTYPDYYEGMEWFWSRDQGGYIMPAEFVKMVERTQTDHLPDPFDPEPVEQGIEVYYTDMNFGEISFAILEDRKFKSAPSVELPHLKVVNGFAQVPWAPMSAYRKSSADLLGERQLYFLKEWAGDWTGVEMKATLSQTIFANVSTYPDTFNTDEGTPQLEPLPKGVIPANYRPAKDMDSNGWPKDSRDEALKQIRKAMALMIGGDQHLATVVQHGVDYWDDAGYSFAVPAIGNLWPRRWFPSQPGRDHIDSLPDYTGKYLDGFGNYINVWAVANPHKTGVYPQKLNDNVVGYGIIRFNKPKKNITLECWPRWMDPISDTARQYDGWPITIDQQQNYNRRIVNWLPAIKVSGLDKSPVIKVINQSDNELVYALRISGSEYTPGVFEKGVYTIIVGEPDTEKIKTITDVESKWSLRDDDIISIDF